jgi:YVTN family beta-propeller protein
MKKYISVSLCFIFALALIFSAPSSLLFSSYVKAQIGSSTTPGALKLPNFNLMSSQNTLRTVPPVANAGKNQMVIGGATVVLNGSGSFDPNRGGNIVYYRWAQVAGVPVNLEGVGGAGVGASSSNTPFPRFIAPILPLNSVTTLTFTLTVTDNFGLTSVPAMVSVSIIPGQQQQLQQRQLQSSITPQQSLPPQQSIGPTPGNPNLLPRLPYQPGIPYRPPNNGILASPPKSPYQYPNPNLNTNHFPQSPSQYPYQLNPGLSNSNRPFGIIPNSNLNSIINSKTSTGNSLVRAPNNGTSNNNTTTAVNPLLPSIKQQPVIGANSKSTAIPTNNAINSTIQTKHSLPFSSAVKNNNPLNPPSQSSNTPQGSTGHTTSTTPASTTSQKSKIVSNANAKSITNPAISGSASSNSTKNKTNPNSNNLQNSIKQSPYKGTSNATAASTTTSQNQSKTNTNANAKPATNSTISGSASPNNTKTKTKVNTNTTTANANNRPNTVLKSHISGNLTSSNLTTSKNQLSPSFKPRALMSSSCPTDGSGAGVLGTITLPGSNNGPLETAFNPVNCDVYVANEGTNTVTVIDGSTNSIVKTIPLPGSGDKPTGGVAVDPSTGNVFIGADQPSNLTATGHVFAIDTTNSVFKTVDVPSLNQVQSNVTDVAYNQATGLVYAANGPDSSVTLIKASTIQVFTTVPLPAGSYPNAIAFYPLNGNTPAKLGDAYITNRNNPGGVAQVFAISHSPPITASSVSTISIPGPFNPAVQLVDIASDGKDMFVLFRQSSPPGNPNNGIAAFDPNTNAAAGGIVINSTPQPPPQNVQVPFHMVYDSKDRTLYLTNPSANDVTNINGTAFLCPVNNCQATGPIVIIPPIGVGHFPTGIAYDSANGELFVSNTGNVNGNGNTVSVTARNLAVTSTNPVDGAQGVALKPSITANFSKPIVASTINTNTFTVTDPVDVHVAGTFSISSDQKNVTFTPSSPLSTSTVYKVTITTGVTAQDSTTLASSKIWTFKTGALPSVTSTNPADAATNVPLTSAITATFNEPVKASTVNTNTFTLTDPSNAQVPGSVLLSSDGLTATFTPSSALQPSVTYTATISTGVQDTNGDNMASPKSWSFTTVAVPPSVTSTSPADGATGVSVASAITATFSEPMKPSTVNTNTFTVTDPSNVQVPGLVSLSSDGLTATFTPTSQLEAAITYTATITTGVQDTNGVNLASPKTWSFTTIAPSVTTTSPIGGATGVPTNSPITATFNEAMKPSTINTNTFTVTDPSDAQVPGLVSLSSDGLTATFTPTNPLQPGTFYTATISSDVQDTNGVTLAAPKTWSFTTIAPSVTTTSPIEGSIQVPTDSSITATFNVPLKASTVNNNTFGVVTPPNSNVSSTIVNGTVSLSSDGLTATFTPTKPLSPATGYRAFITSDIQDSNGNNMTGTKTWTFTTASVPLAVVSTNPPDSATGVPTTTSFSVTFNEPVDPSTVTPSAFTFGVVGNNSTNGDGVTSLSSDGKTVTFTPNSPLSPSSNYAVTVSGISTVDGSTLDTPHSWTFTTSVPPSVTSTNPLDGATNVPLASSVIAIFNEPLNPSTINNNTFTLGEPNACEGCPPVKAAVSLSQDGKTATLTPKSQLQPSILYRAEISTDVQDTQGDNMTQFKSWEFTTVTLPSVTSTSPADGATGVSTTSAVTATFNQPVKASTVNTNTFTLTGPGTTPVAGNVQLSSDGLTATFTPTNPLQPSTTYTATISTGVQDTSGNNMASPKTWSFTTVAVPPSVTSTTPLDGATGVSLTSPSITATFNVALKPSTINTNTFTLQQTSCEFGCAIPGSVTLSPDGKTATFAPTNPLLASTGYTATITTGVQALDGTSMASPKTWSFTTVAAATHATTLKLDPINSAVTGTLSVAASGNLIDAVANTGVSGKTISFTGTGGSPILPDSKTAEVDFTDPTGTLTVGQCSYCLQGVGNIINNLHVNSVITLPPGNSGIDLLTNITSTSSAVSFGYTATFADGSTKTGTSNTVGDTPINGGSSVQSIKITSINGQTTSQPTVGLFGLIINAGMDTSGPHAVAKINFKSVSAGSYPATSANPFGVDKGLFFSIGQAPSTLQQGLTVTASFAGDTAFVGSTSTPAQTYDVIAPTIPAGALGADQATVYNFYGTPYKIIDSSCTANGGPGDGDGICANWKTSHLIPGVTPAGAQVSYNLCYTDQFNNAFVNTNGVLSTSATDNSTSSVQVCPTLGHKEIYLEIDSSTGSTPSVAAIKKVIRAFGNSPVTNTVAATGIPQSPKNGIALHVVLDDKNLPVLSNPKFLYAWQDPCQTNKNTAGVSVTSCGDNAAGGADGKTSCPLDTSGTATNGNPLCVDDVKSNSFAELKASFFGTATERSNTNWASTLAALKAQVYHYAMFVPTWGSACGASGVGLLPGNDLIVALQQPYSGCSGFAQPTGQISTDMQAGTLMHELGHNLGLDHGGPHTLTFGYKSTQLVKSTDYTMNCKPNYLSAMSYTRQMPGSGFTTSQASTWESQALDYSRTNLTGALDASGKPTGTLTTGTSTTPGLSENTAIYNPTANTLIFGTPTKAQTVRTATTGSPVDWDGSGVTSGVVFGDIKYFGSVNPGCVQYTSSSGVVTSGIDPGTASYTAKALDDWDNLKYNFRGSASGGLDGAYPITSLMAEVTPTIFKQQQAQTNQFTGIQLPIGSVCKNGNTCNVGSTIPVIFQLKDVNGNFITNAQVTFTAQLLTAKGDPSGNPFVGPIPSFTYSTKTNTYQYNWKTTGFKTGTYAISLFVDYKKSTQSVLVGPGQNGITLKLQLQ